LPSVDRARRKPPALKVLGMDHVVLRVRDLNRSIRFYRRVLGLKVEHRQPKLGLVHIRAGAQLIDLVALKGPLGRMGGAAPKRVGGRNMDHMALSLARFDEKRLGAHLARHRIDAGQPRPRFGAAGVGPSIYIADPDGNVIELKGPPARDRKR
jgi:catechol 2,3-dioxygenase-like lactoylglutathione lyase family enzyme